MKKILCLACCTLLFAACTSPGNSNEGVTDASVSDTKVSDTTVSDTVTSDTGTTDTGSQDTSPSDQGTPDTAVADTTPDTPAPDTTSDAGTPDTAVADTTTQDGITQDTTTTDNVATDAGTPDVVDTSMSFFITSAGPGDGGDLGGLTGADAHCKKLAEAAGSTGKTWRAYLSTSAENARDRIGTGPWFNAKGVMIAKDVADLHSANNKVDKQNALDEKGAVVNGRGDTPNMHDILTGSTSDGKVETGKTCVDWTSDSAGSAIVGHHDRQGGGTDPTSWNAAHASSGCSQANLVSTGGNGLFYCFAK